MRSLRIAGLGLAVVALWAGSATSVLAADSGSVDVSVSVEVAPAPCLIVSPGVADFGTLPLRSGGSTTPGSVLVHYDNCSTASQVVYGRATDAIGSGPTTWSLVTPQSAFDIDCPAFGLNKYALFIGGGSTVIPLGLSDRLLETIGSGQRGLLSGLALLMPCSGSDGEGAVFSFQVTFTATF